jgi:hypothetical protein
MPTWVRFPNLPLRYWTPLCLSKLASVIGKPIHCDEPTSNKSRLSYARVLIEVDLLGALPSPVNVKLPNGSTLNQQVFYESLPQFCKLCASIRHITTTCKKGSSKSKKRSYDAQPAASPFTGKKIVEQQQPSGPSPLVDTLAVPMTTEIAISTPWKPSSPGRKRTKFVLVVNLASSSVPCPTSCQDIPALPVSWHNPYRSQAPMVS